MSKQRMINTKFWSDSYISTLDPTEKLLFLYLLTNQYTNLLGIYELPIRNMAFDTGIEKEMIERIFDRFTRDNRIYYIDGWIVLRNFVRHQSNSPMIITGMRAELQEIPPEIMVKLEDIDKVCIGYIYDKLNIITSNNLKLNKITYKPNTEEFFEGGDAYDQMLDEFSKVAKTTKEQLDPEFKKFVLYWTESNQSGTKVRWQLQKTFDVKLRLYRWLSNASKFSKAKPQNKVCRI